jgi:hypothetical protein
LTKAKLEDREGKNILLKWPTRTKTIWATPGGRGYWLRGQPKPHGDRATTPTISAPGARLFTTQPDGMWVYLKHPEFADVVAIEVCGSPQNLNDKRARYAATVRSMVLTCPQTWLDEEVPLQRAGLAPRWEACRSIDAHPADDLVLPVRYLRVLFAIPNALYSSWAGNNVADGHEYFCRHSSLDSYTSQAMQRFLRQMSYSSQFFTKIEA